MCKYGESKTTGIMMGTVRHVTSSSGRTKYQADGILFDWMYIQYSVSTFSTSCNIQISALTRSNLTIFAQRIHFHSFFYVLTLKTMSIWKFRGQGHFLELSKKNAWILIYNTHFFLSTINVLHFLIWTAGTVSLNTQRKHGVRHSDSTYKGVVLNQLRSLLRNFHVLYQACRV